MQSSTFLSGATDCGCDYMRVAYMELNRKESSAFDPYRMFFNNFESEIYKVDGMGIPHSKDEVSYCWTSLKSFTVPAPTRVDFGYKCADKIRNVDYNTINCSSLQFRGWISAINLQVPVGLCDPMTAGNWINKDAVRRGASKSFLDEVRPSFLHGAFSNINRDCKEVTIDKFASLVIDATTSGLTVDVFREIQLKYAVANQLSTDSLVLFISDTAYLQLQEDYKALGVVGCCDMWDSRSLGMSGLMTEYYTHIKYCVVPSALLKAASGKDNWMIGLNWRFARFVKGSNYLNAAFFNGGRDTCSKYTDITGYYNLFNIVERYDGDVAGKMPGDFYSYWSLDSFPIVDPLGAIIIKGKA